MLIKGFGILLLGCLDFDGFRDGGFLFGFGGFDGFDNSM